MKSSISTYLLKYVKNVVTLYIRRESLNQTMHQDQPAFKGADWIGFTRIVTPSQYFTNFFRH